MQKNYCDKCGIELTARTGHEYIMLKFGHHNGNLQKELCADCATGFRSVLGTFFNVKVDWTIEKAGFLYGGG